MPSPATPRAEGYHTQLGLFRTNSPPLVSLDTEVENGFHLQRWTGFAFKESLYGDRFSRSIDPSVRTLTS